MSNEKTIFNGIQIAGPQLPGFNGTSGIDWDGSDGWPLVQLWDTHTHQVYIEGKYSTVHYLAYNENLFDCVVPVAFVLDTK